MIFSRRQSHYMSLILRLGRSQNIANSQQRGKKLYMHAVQQSQKT